MRGTQSLNIQHYSSLGGDFVFPVFVTLVLIELVASCRDSLAAHNIYRR